MADFNFPSTPNPNDLYTLNGITYRYDGSRWRYANVSVVTITSGTAVTAINTITSSNQNFAVGYSGSTLNISSSGNTHTFNIPLAGNATTGLVSGDAQTIYGIKTFNSSLVVSDSTNSTSTSTGAVRVTGGTGIGQSLSVGGRLQLFNSSNYTAFVSSASGNTVYTLPATSPATGSSVLQSTSAGIMSWVPMVASGGGAGTVDNGLVNSLSYYSATGTAVTGATSLKYISGTGLSITDTTANIGSTFSGALQVAGGVGIGGTLFVSSAIILNSGSIGLSFQKLVGGNYGAIYSTGVTPSATNYTMITDGASVNFNGTNGVYFNISNSNKIQVTTNNINITPTAASTSTSTGALTVAGGVGIGGSLYVASATAISGVVINNGIITGNLTGTATTAQNVNANNASSNAQHTILFSPNATGSGLAVSSNTAISFNPSTLVLSSSGLAVTAGTASTSFSTGALVVTGGVGIGGSVYIQGDLTINGTTTTINSTILSVDDKNIIIGDVTSPSDVTAEAGGITLRGATDKSINWYAGTGWSSSESFNLSSGNSYKINNASVLNATTLGSAVVSSSLTSVGILSSGTWSATAITAHYGGTGLQSPFVVGDLIYANTTTTWARLAAGTAGSILTSAGAGTTPYWAAPSAGSGGTATINTGLINTFPYYNASGTAVTGLSNFVYTGSGIALSFATNSTSTTTGSLSIRGGIGITGNAFIGGTVTITSSTASTNTSSGALVLAGGLGLTGQLSYNYSQIGSTGIASNPVTAFIGTTGSPITLTVLADNSLLYEGSSGKLFGINNNLSSGWIFNVGDISGLPIIRANADGTIAMAEFAANVGVGISNPSYKLQVSGSAGISGTTSVTSSAASTNTSSGAFVVTGGVGIGGSLYVASATAISGVTINAGVITGSLTGTATTSGFATTAGLATTATYATQSGYGITSGTATTSNNINIVSAGSNSSHRVLFTPASGTASGAAVSVETSFVYNPSTDILSVSGLAVTSTTTSTSTSTGAFTVTGGVGIGGSLYVASATAISGVTINAGVITGSLTGTATTSGFATTAGTATTATYALQAGYGITAGTATTAQNINVANASTNSAHPLHFSPSATGTGLATSSNTTLSYNPSTLVLSTSGLAITAGTASTNTSTGALVVTGGVGIGGSVFIQGDLTINGTTTTINSTTLTVDDKNIELGSVSVPSDVTAEGGGITLRGATDKNINWYAGAGWSSSESWNLAAGNTYKINNTTVISNSSIGTGITNSSLTALGTISTGTWSATAITAHYGGTGLQSPFVVGDLIYANTTTTWARVAAGTAGSILTSAGAGTTPYWAAPSGAGGAGTVYSSLINTFAYYNITGTAVTGLANFVNTGSGIALSFATNSTSTTTGSLSIRGGVGITGNAFIGGTTTILSTTSSTGTSAGSLVNTGGFGNLGNAFIGGTTTITNTTSSTNSTSGALVVSGGVGVGGSVFIGNRLVVSSTTGSTNTSSGAVVIAGGLGLTGQLSFNSAQIGSTGIATNPSMAFIGTTGSPITLSVLSDNSLSFEGSSGQLFAIDNNLTSGEIFSVSDISGLPIISASAGQTVSINEFGGYTQIGNGSISASSTSTGSLVVFGGVGITSNAFIGGTTTITNTTNSSSTTSGALVVNGGIGITGNANIGGTTRITSTTQASYGSTTSGALVVTGGVGIGGSVYIGGQLGVGGTLDYNATGNVAYFAGNNNSYTQVIVHNHNTGNSASSDFIVSNDSTTDTTFFGDFGMNSSGWGATTSAYNTANAVYLASNSGDLAIGSLTANPIRFFYNNGITDSVVFGSIAATVNYATNSTSTTSGALQVKGGLGITGNAFIGGTTTITNTTASTGNTSGALVVSGGAAIGQSLFVGGNLNLTGVMNSGTNTFTKTVSSGDIALDNGTIDTPAILFYWGNNRNMGIDTFYSGSGTTKFRITKELNEAGGTELWSVDRNGIVTRSAWDVGEVINTRVYNNTDLNMSATTTISSTTYTNVATITYTPKSSTSHLWIEFDAHYDYSNGTTTDDFFSRITVAGSTIMEKNQIFVGAVGGGTRSGVIFPISGRYTNSTTSGIAISVQARWGSADDNLRVYGSSTSGYMRIQEIGR